MEDLYSTSQKSLGMGMSYLRHTSVSSKLGAFGPMGDMMGNAKRMNGCVPPPL